MSEITFSEQHSVTLVEVVGTARETYSLEAAARLADVHPDLLRHYCSLGLLGADRARADAELEFDDEAIYELRCIEHYRRHHGVNMQALPLLLDLLREVERLNAELRFLRRV